MRLLSSLLLLAATLAPAPAQNTFSPFSFLNSFLSQVPGWPLHQPVKHQPRSTLPSLSVPSKQKLSSSPGFFRPHLQLGPAISPVPAPVQPKNVATLIRPAPTLASHHHHHQQTSSGVLSVPVSGVQSSSSVSSSSTVFIGSPQLAPSTSSREARNNKVDIPAAELEPVTGPALATFKKTSDPSSGPNPGTGQEDFPIISLIDEPSSHLVANYYDSVLQNIGSGGPVNNNINSINTNNNNNNNNDNSFISSPTLAPASSPNFKNSFAASSFNPNPNSFGAAAASQGAAGLNSLSNPYYAPEEFTYNQDPILIDHSDSEEEAFKEITEQDYDDDDHADSDVTEEETETEQQQAEAEASFNEIEDTVSQQLQIKPTLLPTFLEEIEEISKKTEKASRSLTPKDVFRKRVKSKELTNLVKTIEYKPSDILKRTTPAPQQSSPLLSRWLDSVSVCPSYSSLGYCSSSSPALPPALATHLLEHCGPVMAAFQAQVPLDLSELGDNSGHVITSAQDTSRPWSWVVTAYQKRPVCDSEIAFIRPTLARDSLGREVVVVQGGGVAQTVSVDSCRGAGQPCPGHCGTSQSICVQRFTHHHLLALPRSGDVKCPIITAVKLPSGCVCHAQTRDPPDSIFGDKLV